MCHHARLIFVFLVEMGFHHVGQDGLDLLASRKPPLLAGRTVGIIGMSHCACDRPAGVPFNVSQVQSKSSKINPQKT